MPASPPAPFDVIVLGAGAAGLFCAGIVGQRGLRVLVIGDVLAGLLALQTAAEPPCTMAIAPTAQPASARHAA